MPNHQIEVNGEPLSPFLDEEKSQHATEEQGEDFNLKLSHRSNEQKKPLKASPILFKKVVT